MLAPTFDRFPLVRKSSDDRLKNMVTLLKRDKYASGQALAAELGLSRAAVWKQIRRLRQDGYRIEAKQGTGYRLVYSTSLPVPWELHQRLKTRFIGKHIIYHAVLDSTQRLALAMAKDEKHPSTHGTVVIAERQKSGRGRIARKWVSPQGGLWLSVILKPQMATSKSTIMPLAAAVAVCASIRKGAGLDATVKWPNDVLVNGKKVAGILMDLSAEADTINYLVVGIGINANVDPTVIVRDIQDELRTEVTSLRAESGKDVNLLDFTTLLLTELERCCDLIVKEDGPAQIIRLWKKMSDTIGSNIVVMPGQTAGQDRLICTAVDIDRDGSLVVRLPDGKYQHIVSGDISVIPASK